MNSQLLAMPVVRLTYQIACALIKTWRATCGIITKNRNCTNAQPSTKHYERIVSQGQIDYRRASRRQRASTRTRKIKRNTPYNRCDRTPLFRLHTATSTQVMVLYSRTGFWPGYWVCVMRVMPITSLQSTTQHVGWRF
jgi:hypothetical protein